MSFSRTQRSVSSWDRTQDLSTRNLMLYHYATMLLWLCSVYVVILFTANRSCPPNGMFACANRTQGQCIPLTKQCDGIPDCQDASDEVSCPCPQGQFKCKNGLCLPKVYRCNGIRECSDGSDEVACGKLSALALLNLVAPAPP